MTSPAWPEWQLKLLDEMWAAGDTALTISHALGNRTRSAVLGMARRRNLKERPRPVPEPKVKGPPRRGRWLGRALYRAVELVAEKDHGLTGAAAGANAHIDDVRKEFARLRARYDFGLPATMRDDVLTPERPGA